MCIRDRIQIAIHIDIDIYKYSRPAIRLSGYPAIRLSGYPGRVSLEIPGFPSSHSRFLGFRRLTRDSRNRRLTRDSRIPDFFWYKFWKIVKIGFSDSRDQNKITKFI